MAWICIGRLRPDCIRSVRRSVQNGSQSSYIQITSRSHHLPPPPGPPRLPRPRPRPRPLPSQPPRPHHPSQPPYLPSPPPHHPFEKRSILHGFKKGSCCFMESFFLPVSIQYHGLDTFDVWDLIFLLLGARARGPGATACSFAEAGQLNLSYAVAA